MNKNILKYLLIASFAVLVANFIALLILNRTNVEFQMVHQLTDNSAIAEYNLKQMQSIINSQYNARATYLNGDIYLQTVTDDSVLLVNEFRSERFVIRFNDIGCSACVEDFFQSIPQLNDFILKIGIDNVCIIINSKSPRDILFFKKHYKIMCDVYGALPGSINTPMESNGRIVPFYFIELGVDGLVDNCFVSIKGLNQRNDAYFNSVIRKYNNP